MILNRGNGNQSGDTLPLVSVVIPSYNSSKHIRACLNSLLCQVSEIPFEVILVDSSNDGTDQIVRAEFPQIRMCLKIPIISIHSIFVLQKRKLNLSKGIKASGIP